MNTFIRVEALANEEDIEHVIIIEKRTRSCNGPPDWGITLEDGEIWEGTLDKNTLLSIEEAIK